jgi:hypothetical protein
MSGTCDEPFTITQGETAMGDTTGEADDLTAVSASGFGSCQTGGAGEHVYAFTPTAGGTVTATLSSVADLGLFVRHGCDDGATEFSCVDDVGGGTDEELTLTVVANATYYLVVDGYGAGEEGAYTLTIGDVTGEADCTDGVDDNGNVLVDCEDPSCLTDASCVTAIGATCGAASGLMPGMDQAGDTSMGSPDFATVAPTCTGAGGALVEAYEYTPGADSLLRLELSSATDQGFFVRSQCDGPQSQVACTDFQYGGDNEIDYVPVSSGTTYSVFVSAYQAAEEGPYSLRSDVFGLDETEPNEDTASANAAGMSQLGYIGTQNDQDWYEITIAQASDVVVETADVAMGDCEAGQIDTDLELFQSDGTTSVAFNDDIDDTNDNYCSRVEGQALAAGTYYVRVRSSEAYCAACTVPYRLTVDIAE